MCCVWQVSETSTKGFAVVQRSVGRCIELTAGYQARDLLKEAADALSAFLKVTAPMSKMIGIVKRSDVWTVLTSKAFGHTDIPSDAGQRMVLLCF